MTSTINRFSYRLPHTVHDKSEERTLKWVTFGVKLTAVR